jgi:FkbM family methyltransferase
MANAPCFLTSLAHNELRFRPVHICTHDPAKDQVMADSFHKWKWWGANLDHRFCLAAGHAGTPLTAVDAARMRYAAARSGYAHDSTHELVAALKLPPPPSEPPPHAACSRERPFVLDVGGNIGYYTLVAAATGCSVVAVEPLSANTGRLFASILANGFEDQVTLFKNAVGKDSRLVTLDLNAGNPGASSVSDGSAAKADGVRGGDGLGGGDGARETVATVVLDELFDGGAERPRHPFTGRPIAPTDVALIKVDVEGFDGAALWALRGMIEQGRPPLIKIEYEAPRVRGTSGCDNVGLMRWLYSLGYAAYGFGHGHPLTLEEWEEKIIPYLLEGKSDELAKEHKLPVLRELYIVHKDAPVPAAMDSDGPQGGKKSRAPV